MSDFGKETIKCLDALESAYQKGRADAFVEAYEQLCDDLCDMCDKRDYDAKCYNNCQEERRIMIKWLSEKMKSETNT